MKKRSPDTRSGARTQQVTLKSGLQSRWQNHRDVAGSSLKKLLITPFSTVMTVAVIAIALLLPTALFVAMDNLSALSEGFGRLSRITLYLEDNLSERDSSALSEQLLARPDIAAVEYISPAQGAEEFARYSGLGDVLSLLDDNPLPGVMLVTPTDAGARSSTLLGELAGLEGVSLAQLDLQWIERLRLLLETAGRASTALMLVFALAVLLVIGNTIRLAIESRRAEIVVVKLVGGTDGYVARPFLYTGLWYGLAGGLLAWLALTLLLLALYTPTRELLALYDSQHELRGLGVTGAAALLAGSGLLGWLGAFISVRQHLSEIEPS